MSLIVKKYDYQPISRKQVEGKRLYATPDGNAVASVTTILDATKEDQVMDDVVVWGSEVNLYMPQMYAGTTDLVGTYKGQPAIMDFKQTNKPKKLEWVVDYFLQLTAYAEAHNEIYGTDIREGHVFMCSRAGEYQQFDIWPDEYDEWRTEIPCTMIAIILTYIHFV